MTAPARAATDPVKVAVDFHTFDGIFQGSRSHLLGLYREAIIQAPDIQFMFFLAGPGTLLEQHPEFGRPNVRLIAMAQRPGIWRLLRQLPSLQRRHSPDVLHMQFRLPLFPAGPCICTVHDVLFETHPQYFNRVFVRIARLGAERAVRRSAFTLTVSEYSRRQIGRLYGCDPQDVVLTRNAVDRVRFHPRAESAISDDEGDALRRWGLVSGEYLCTLGRLEPRKNHVRLLHAYARLESGTPSLLMIGQRDLAYDEISKTIRTLGLSSRVRILEDVDDASLPVLLRHALLLAYPTYAEGFGMPVLEALASGIPVITSDTTSLPEVAGPGAVLVPPHDEHALVEALRQVLAETPAVRQARVDAGLLHAAQFDWAEAARNLVAAVRATVAGQRRR